MDAQLNGARRCWLSDADGLVSKHIQERVCAEFKAEGASAPASKGEVGAATTMIFSWIYLAEAHVKALDDRLMARLDALDAQVSRTDRLEQRLSAATKEIAALRRQLGADA